MSEEGFQVKETGFQVRGTGTPAEEQEEKQKCSGKLAILDSTWPRGNIKACQFGTVRPKPFRNMGTHTVCMLKFENELEIKRPAKEVFQFLSNFENMPKWNYFVVDVKKITDGQIGLGTTFRQVRKTDTQDYKIIEYEPDRKVAVKTIPPYADLTMRFTLSSKENDNTLLNDQWEFDTGKPAFVERLGGGKIKSAVAENLSKLKELLEAGETTLQDGRREHLK